MDKSPIKKPKSKPSLEGIKPGNLAGERLIEQAEDRSGQQEQSAYNGHFESSCYHPLLLFNREGDCLAARQAGQAKPARRLRRTAKMCRTTTSKRPELFAVDTTGYEA